MFKLNIPHSQCAPISFSSFHPYSRHRFVFHIFVLFGDHLGEWTSLVAQRLKCLPPMWETRVWSLGRDNPLEKEMVTHSSILAWRIPWTEKPGRLQSTGSQRVGHNWVTSLHLEIWVPINTTGIFSMYYLSSVTHSSFTFWNKATFTTEKHIRRTSGIG